MGGDSGQSFKKRAAPAAGGVIGKRSKSSTQEDVGRGEGSRLSNCEWSQRDHGDD